MSLQDPNHPVWDVAEIGMLLVFCTVALAVNASHFDETELKAIMGHGRAISNGRHIAPWNLTRGTNETAVSE